MDASYDVTAENHGYADVFKFIDTEPKITGNDIEFAVFLTLILWNFVCETLQTMSRFNPNSQKIWLGLIMQQE